MHHKCPVISDGNDGVLIKPRFKEDDFASHVGNNMAKNFVFATRRQAEDSTSSTEPILLPTLAAYRIALCEQGAATSWRK